MTQHEGLSNSVEPQIGALAPAPAFPGDELIPDDFLEAQRAFMERQQQAQQLGDVVEQELAAKGLQALMEKNPTIGLFHTKETLRKAQIDG
jgi:hypothetical protein